MMIFSRRGFFGVALASLASFVFSRSGVAGQQDAEIRHILPSVTDHELWISTSFYTAKKEAFLNIGERVATGTMVDSVGHNWTFYLDGLRPNTEYRLQLSDGSDSIGEPWNLKTFPANDSLPDSFKLLAFTCAGGADGFGTPTKQFFKPHAFRQKLFASALSQNPDAAIAIGDHVYWDLRGGSIPAVGKNSLIIKTFAGWYLKFKYGAFDRDQGLLNTSNEDILKKIGNEQIADLYGTQFKSTPIYFVADDHDYFENDDAEAEIVTFPPDKFSRAAHKAIADLYYPPLPNAPDPQKNRSFGMLKYGRLFESPLFDCAGFLSLGGDQATLIPDEIEKWILDRVKNSSAIHFAVTPSHPLGWTAGKWREWYPDVVAPADSTGVVTNALLEKSEGELSVKAEKYLWQTGWWNQHQRLLSALANRPTSRLIISGDIHALGALSIQRSGDLDFSNNPVKSFLTGPVSTSEATWPSSARGITADTPKWLSVENLSQTSEVNGFTLFSFDQDGMTASVNNCGGFNLSDEDDGSVKAITHI